MGTGISTEEYSQLINKTAVYPTKVDNFGLAYAFLGLQDEFIEFYEKLILGDKDGAHKELGDIVWYIAAICKETNLIFSDLIKDLLANPADDLYDVEEVLFIIASYSGNVKKYYRDNKPLDLEKLYKEVLLAILQIVFYDGTEEEIMEVLQKNYDKLIKRRETNTIHGDGDNREDTPKAV